jgi:hypothetical protein
VHDHRPTTSALFAVALTAACSSQSDAPPQAAPLLPGASAASEQAMADAPVGSGSSVAGVAGSPGAASGNAAGAASEANLPGEIELTQQDAGTLANGSNPPVGTPPAPGAPPVNMGGVFGLGGPSRCGDGLAICESFEGAALGAAVPAGWTTGGYGNRTLAVVDDDSARGDRSLRIDVAGNQGAVVGMLIRADLGALGARHFGRSFLKIAAPAPTGFVHFDAFEARGNYQGQTNMVRWASTGTNAGGSANNWSWIYNVQSTNHGEFGSEGNRSAHPRDGAWMCLEWSIEEAAQEARFWFDAMEVDYLHIDTERAEIPVFDTFHVGFQKFQQTAGAWRVWVDEVAFDDQRIGCDG